MKVEDDWDSDDDQDEEDDEEEFGDNGTEQVQRAPTT